ncbi:hypothetical protein [Rhodococcus baikonurensis]|uniref:Uncharacterized protein n=1 Tax=Rhodococcus baikonurensis TaxID=172041 RepID=A0ABV5XUR0_9NOCA
MALLDEDDLTLTLPSDMTPDERKNDLQPWSEKARVLSDTLEDLRNGGDGTAVDRFTDEQWNEIFQRSKLTDAEENALVDRYLLEQAGAGMFHMLLLQLAPPVPPLPPVFDDDNSSK